MNKKQLIQYFPNYVNRITFTLIDNEVYSFL